MSAGLKRNELEEQNEGAALEAKPGQEVALDRIVNRVIAAMLLGVLVYGAIVAYRGATGVLQRFGHFAFWAFGAACALSFSNYLLRFLKWQYYLRVLRIEGIPRGESFLIFLSGFVLTVTPGKLGEVFKSLLLWRIRKIPIERTAPIVVAERVTDLIGVIVLITVGSLSFTGGLFWAAMGVLAVGTLLVCTASRKISELLLRPIVRLPGSLGRIGRKLVPKILLSLDSLRDLTAPKRLVWPTLLSIVGWALEGIGLWIILRGFDEHPSLLLCAFFYATSTLAGALIPLPGGLGVTDEMLLEQMTRIGGVGSNTATASMLLVRFATLWFAVVVGFAALSVLRARHSELFAKRAPNEGDSAAIKAAATQESAVGNKNLEQEGR